MNSMNKQSKMAAMLLAAGMMVAGSASGDYLLFDGGGTPTNVFTESGGYNESSRYRPDSIFGGSSGTHPGFLSTLGNAGGFLGRDWDLNEDGIIDNGSPAMLKSQGWEVQWRSIAINTNQPSSPSLVIGGGDDVNNWQVHFAGADGGSVFLRTAGTPGPANSATYTNIGLTQWHTFQVIRDAGSSDIALKIDGTQVLSLTLNPCGLPFCDGGNLNVFQAAPSQVEWAYDFINIVPEPSSAALLGVAGLALLRRRIKA